MGERKFLGAAAALNGGLTDGAHTAGEDAPTASPDRSGGGADSDDRGPADAAVAGAEVFIPPADARVSVESYQPVDSDGQQITLRLKTPRETGGINLSLFLTEDRARDLSERLVAAANGTDRM